MKKRLKKFHHQPYSIPFPCVLHQHKASHNFCKRGQHLIVEHNVGLEYALGRYINQTKFKNHFFVRQVTCTYISSVINLYMYAVHTLTNVYLISLRLDTHFKELNQFIAPMDVYNTHRITFILRLFGILFESTLDIPECDYAYLKNCVDL